MLADLEDIDDLAMEYPSPLKIRSDKINDQLEMLEKYLDSKNRKEKVDEDLGPV